MLLEILLADNVEEPLAGIAKSSVPSFLFVSRRADLETAGQGYTKPARAVGFSVLRWRS
jgi:hypothetical protein